MNNDVTDVLVKEILNSTINLYKETFEIYGEYLGQTNNEVKYKNYFSYDSFSFGDNLDISSIDLSISNYTIDPKMLGKLDANLSEHFKLRDLCVTSQCKVEQNVPMPEHEKNLYRLANEILEPIYKLANGNIKINSAYRSPFVNNKIGGSKTSQHSLGQAVDLDAKNGLSNTALFTRIFNAISAGKLKVGQLIWEGGDNNNPAWIHVSLPYNKVNNVIALAPKRNIDYILRKNNLSKTSNMT